METKITLYRHPVSGNSHRATAMLHLLGLDFEDVIVDLPTGEHKSPDFLAINPLGQVPALKDGDVVLRDSLAILVYLARQYDRSNQWLPESASESANVQQWLSTSATELRDGPAMLRAMVLFGSAGDREAIEKKTVDVLTQLFEPQLNSNDWLVGDQPTIADIACYPYLARASEGNFDLKPFGAVTAWIDRLEALPDFVPMGNAAELLKS